ncbi:Decaprenyl diphosphate synthase-like protein [Dioszegia hungarica]|uniref:Alkyl transferase n=1 Tax=Dioszegia hungarica TaxID=4972 RepID=A0AA38LRX2_9TREE|nr:Decaprenyl diphosphate synthase-like protein [Dioszegia hungarica]KAI9634977.1 Decaprenyl diphosphate synthase-like protein [Dioszegia hungarica]
MSVSTSTTASISQHLLSVFLHRFHALATTVLLYLLSLGPMPKHVGFVMDGNRRYARGRGKRVVEGHTDGFQSLRRILEVCLKLRIRAVSIYAFSIDNFSRDEEEVAELMRLAKTRLMELCEHGDLLQKYGVRIRFIGRREMLPPDVRGAVEDMERLTARHTRRALSGVLNVCCPYTSRDEILGAVKRTVRDSCSEGRISASDITSENIYGNLESCESISALRIPSAQARIDRSEDLDIFVRTSNVKRLSDFMMWQSSQDTQLHFVRTMWPEFGLTDMLPILLGWQQKVWLARLGH